ncbi:SIR2 family protein [Rhodococcus sp. NM-2]|uniref:SIR2 family protein n=1 Tax=Rhodococcus sp. NM-2 TaxID=3401174 RepID=UPI003AACF5AC
MNADPDLGIAEALLPLAFSLHANPGAYAILAGAGISYGAVPVAWEVFTDLIVRAAGIDGDIIEQKDAEDWYRKRFSSQPTYEGVLEKLGPTPTERGTVLREYFEPGGELPEPTEAHRAAARLMKTGAIRIVVTMNFDRLFEQALRDVGVEPLIVATDAQAIAIEPLHTVRNCIIHLHGEYQDASSLRNTVEELSAYPSNLRSLDGQIVREYGMIIVGWSAEYDTALREIIDSNYPHRYTATWIDPANPKAKATELLKRLGGIPVRATADEAFGHMADAVESLATRRARNPMTLPIAVETAKREMSGQHTSIALHDRLQAEFQRIHSLDDWTRTEGQGGEYPLLVARVEEASAVASALVAVLAYWGAADTDRWWTSEIERFARTTRASGSTAFLEARRLVGTRLLYAAGIGALAAHRYDTLQTLIRLTTPSIYTSGKQDPLMEVLSAGSAYRHIAQSERRHREQLEPVLAQALALTHDSLDITWQQFEILRLTAVLLAHPEFDAQFTEYHSHKRMYDHYVKQIEDAGDDQTQKPIADAAWNAKPGAWENVDKALGSLSRMVNAGRPHILMTDSWDGNPRWISPLLEQLQREVETDFDRHPLRLAGIAKTSDELLAALQAVQHRLGLQAQEHLRASRTMGTSREPDDIWLDIPVKDQ